MFSLFALTSHLSPHIVWANILLSLQNITFCLSPSIWAFFSDLLTLSALSQSQLLLNLQSEMRLFGLLFVVVCLISIDSTVSWRTFWKGRRVGGNVGHPEKFHRIESSADDSEDRWFDQIFDHFDPRNNLKWKQVRFLKWKIFIWCAFNCDLWLAAIFCKRQILQKSWKQSHLYHDRRRRRSDS